MRGSRILAGLVCAGVLVCGVAGGGDEAGQAGKKNARRAQLKQIDVEQKALGRKLAAVQKRLGLQRDPEIAELKKKAATANAAMKARMKEKTAGDPEGSKIVVQIGEIDVKIKGLRKEQKELHKSLASVQKRMGLAEDSEIVGLREQASAAQSAAAARIKEKTAGDTEGQEILGQLDELNKKLKELRKPRKKPAKKPEKQG